MTDIDRGSSLLQAILDEPDADDLRLIYADWLEDHGVDLFRAEVIRGMIRDNRPQFLVGEYVHMYAADLLGTIIPDGGYIPDYVEVKRGFVHTVRCPTATWLQHRVELVRKHPLQRVELTDREPARNMAGGRYWHDCEHCFREGATYAVNADLVGEYDGNPSYFTPEQAKDWLSDALLKEARRLAKELEKKEVTQ